MSFNAHTVSLKSKLSSQQAGMKENRVIEEADIIYFLK